MRRGQAPTHEPRLLLATSNQHKVGEILQILSREIDSLDPSLIGSMADFSVDSPIENGLTFADNAQIKARALAKATGLPALADDSGIVVSAMGSAPGIFSARWAGHGASDEENLKLLLDQLADIDEPHSRQARFVCAAAIALPDGTTVVEHGEMHGHLLKEPRGSHGFGYDPAFVPIGAEVTTAEMAPEDKNLISHRSRALTAIAPRVREVLGL